MDRSQGVQIPEGILPGVSVLKPGLALCLRHSQVDKRYVDNHIELLSQTLPSELYPAFIARDTATGSLSDIMTALHRLRKEALEENRVYFVYSPYFAARLSALTTEVDHLFFYAPGLARPVIITHRVNCVGVDGVAILPHLNASRNRERKMLQIRLPEGVNEDEASRLISEALAGKYNGFIDIEAVKNA